MKSKAKVMAIRGVFWVFGWFFLGFSGCLAGFWVGLRWIVFIFLRFSGESWGDLGMSFGLITRVRC